MNNKKDLEAIQQLNQKKTLIYTVAFSADNNYAAPLGVAIKSLLNTISSDFFCDIVILDSGISKRNKFLLRTLTNHIEFASIRFYDVTNIFSDAPVWGYYSKAVYTQLLVPYIFRNFDMVLVLDCDIILQDDISSLFETKFSNELVAAVRDVGIPILVRDDHKLVFKEEFISWRHYINFYLHYDKDEINDIINSGVLLFNISSFREDDFLALQEVEELIKFGYFLVDQCISNILFKKRIIYLPMRWNLLVQEDRIEKLDGDFPTEYLEAEKNPAIIHYIIDRKPWKKHLVLYESEFWNVAQETPWFTELQDNLICSD